MVAWIAASAVVCALLGALGSGSLIPVATNVQSFLLLGMALAATVLLGAFDAYEGQAPVQESADEN